MCSKKIAPKKLKRSFWEWVLKGGIDNWWPPSFLPGGAFYTTPLIQIPLLSKHQQIEKSCFFVVWTKKISTRKGLLSLCESIGVLKLNGGGGGEKIKQTLFLHLRRHRLNIFQLEKQNRDLSKDCNKVDHRQVVERQELTWWSGRLHPSSRIRR